MKSYDIIVIGSGGGSKITRPAANMGKKVAIIESGRLGGTCLNHGCIPSKMLIHPADVVEEIRGAEKFSLTVDQNISVDFKGLVSRVSQTIDGESDSIQPLYDKHDNIDFYPHHARFVADKVIEVNGEQLTAEQIFVVTGAKASIPPIPGLEGTPYLTYKEALRLEQKPKSMIVLGGGYIAVELGHYFANMGIDVTFVVRSVFVRAEDKDVQDEFTAVFKQKHRVYQGVTTDKVSHDGTQFQITISSEDGPKVLAADQLFVATGVVPNTDKLGLENTAVQTSDDGYIKVDDRFETAVPGVYAFGDVIGRYLFRHSANFEGEYVFNAHVAKTNDKPVEYPPVPHAIFTNPQIAGVGKTEQELAGTDYIVGKNNYAASAMGIALLSDHGFAKVLFDKKTRKLVGAHIIGEEASNMIHMCIIAMTMGATIDDLSKMIYIHPALPEIVRNAIRKAKAEFCQL